MNNSSPQDKGRSNGQGTANTRASLKGISAGLFEEDVAVLNELSSSLEVSRSVLVRAVIRDFLAQFEAGKAALSSSDDGEVQVSRKKTVSGKKAKKKKGTAKSGKGRKKSRGKKKSTKGKK